MFITPDIPNAADFATFVADQGVSIAELPADSPYLTYAFDYAQNVTNQVPEVPQSLYTLAVYNCGMHRLLLTAPDQPGQTTFTAARKAYNLLTFVAGAVTSASDNGTSQSLSGSKAVADLSLSAMGFLKTPWGQRYLEYTQQYGPNVCGLT